MNTDKVWNCFTPMDLYYRHGYKVHKKAKKNVFITDEKVEIVDMVSSLLTTSFGYCREDLTEILRKQSQILDITTLFHSTSDKTIENADKLSRLLNNKYSNFFYTNSGSEAIDSALKLAFEIRGKGKIMYLKNAYHGSSLFSSVAFGSEADDILNRGEIAIEVEPIYEKSFKEKELRYQYKLISKLIKENNVVCIVVELIQLSNHCQLISKEYIKMLERLCKEWSIIFIVDEIATGFGRANVSEIVLSNRYSISPDILLLGKSLTNGLFPISVIAIKDEIFMHFINKQKIFMNGFTTF